MKYKVEVFQKQYPLVKYFVYHLLCYRELLKVYNEINYKSEFWSLTIDAHLFQATTYWCMVFGSDRLSQTHWKKLNPDESEILQENFRNGLLSTLNLNDSEWNIYWNKIVHFRNNYVSHRCLDFKKPVPYFDIALDVAFFYDKWIRELIFPDIFDEPELRESAKLFEKKIKLLINTLLKKSKRIGNCISKKILK